LKTVEKVEIEVFDRPVKVYNFEVEDWHTYYVTEQGVLVHNAKNYDGNGNTGVGNKGTSKTVTYSPANPGPLKQSVAETFSGATYKETVLTQDTTFYRVYGGSSGKVGSYMTRVPQNGGMQSQVDLALNPQWGNTAQYVTKVTVPKGTVIYEGTAAPQVINGGAGQLIGGGNQVYIPEVDASWFK